MMVSTHHLIFKVLCGNKRIQKVHSPLSLICYNLATSSAYIRIDIESLPKMVYGRGSRSCTNVEQDADVWLEDGSKGVEEPPMGVNLAKPTVKRQKLR